MRRTTAPYFLAFALLCSAACAQSIVITDDSLGLIVQTLDATKPSEAGFVLSREVQLPEFKRGVYYRPFSGGPARGNRVEAVAFDSIADLQAYQPSKTRAKHNNIQQGQFILLELTDGRYLALLPMTSQKVYGQFFVEDNKLSLKAGSFGTESISGEIPLVIWASGDSPYAATHSVWQQVFASGYVAAQPRVDKKFPEEPYGYLGWCSWEHYKRNISEKVITKAVQALEASDAPFRWVMVDDGYFTEKKRKLVSLKPEPEKFPNGWDFINTLKRENDIKWFGVWRNMLGYMEGISPDHAMTDLSDELIPAVKKKSRGMAKGEYLVPAETREAAQAFHNKMARDAKESGFDFTKVDFQTKAFDLYGGLGNAARDSQFLNAALEDACHSHGLPLLNCIAQPNINSMQFKYSVLARSSPDYNQQDKDKNKCNTYQSFANHLWMAKTVWGDLDMFHTHDQRDVNPMAIARAISGGPVYVSDEPLMIVSEVLIPFAFQDGKLLRTAAPATLLPESFFIHPFRDQHVFRVVAPLADGVAAIALFNFSESGKSLSSGFHTKDYSHAGELSQPEVGPWAVPTDGLLVYDREARSVIELGEGFTTEVPNFDAKLFLLYPKTKGWAVIGRSDKYLPSAAVEINTASDQEITFTLKESGPLMVWSEKGVPQMTGATFESLGNGLYFANLEIVKGSRQVILKR